MQKKNIWTLHKVMREKSNRGCVLWCIVLNFLCIFKKKNINENAIKIEYQTLDTKKKKQIMTKKK